MKLELRDILTLLVFTMGIILSIWAKVSFAKKSDIYRQDGETKFPTVGGCDDTHQKMEQTLVEIKKAIKDADDKRDKTRSEISDCLKKLNKELSYLHGRFDQATKNGKNETPN